MRSFRDFLLSKNESVNSSDSSIKVSFEDLPYSFIATMPSQYYDRAKNQFFVDKDVMSHKETHQDLYTGSVIIPFSQSFLEAAKSKNLNEKEFIAYLTGLQTDNDMYEKYIDDMKNNTFDIYNAEFDGKIVEGDQIPEGIYDSVIEKMADKLSTGNYEVLNAR
jgi:hypothetical protein